MTPLLNVGVRERRRLMAIAGRLSSTHDGEIVNAARMLVRRLSRNGVTLGEVVENAAVAARLTDDAYVADGWPDSGPAPSHVSRIDALLAVQRRSLMTRRTKALLRVLRNEATLSADETRWLDALQHRVTAGRQRAVRRCRASRYGRRAV